MCLFEITRFSYILISFVFWWLLHLWHKASTCPRCPRTCRNIRLCKLIIGSPFNHQCIGKLKYIKAFQCIDYTIDPEPEPKKKLQRIHLQGQQFLKNLKSQHHWHLNRTIDEEMEQGNIYMVSLTPRLWSWEPFICFSDGNNI